MDYVLVETLAQMPGRLKLAKGHHRCSKSLLVDALPVGLPGEVLRRPKMGFVFPWNHWLRNELRPRVDEILTDRRSLNAAASGTVRGSTVVARIPRRATRRAYTDILCLVHLLRWVNSQGLSAQETTPSSASARIGQLAPRMPVTPNHSRSAERAPWADCLKGIAILLVVVGHVIGGLRDSAILANSPTVSYVYDWIYAFHMPAFFFVAGAFAAGSLRRGLARFLVKKAGVLLYPYFLWALLGWSAALVMATYVNAKPKPLTLGNALKFFAQLVYSPAGPWFLYALFWILLLFGTLAALQVKPRWFLLFAALLFAAHALGYFGFSKELDLVSGYLIYFALGVVLSDRTKSLALVAPSGHANRRGSRLFHTYVRVAVLA